LNDAISICEIYINTDRALSVIAKSYRVNKTTFAVNLAKVNVQFADWKKWDNQPRKKRVALSWIDKYEVYQILINQTLWRRYRVTSDAIENKRIIFIVALCILHELGHLCIQWSYDKRLILNEFLNALN
jgi:hypothetical protein